MKLQQQEPEGVPRVPRSELKATRFRWGHYSIPGGISLTDHGNFFVEVTTNEHLAELIVFFRDVYSTLITTRDMYEFRDDPK